MDTYYGHVIDVQDRPAMAVTRSSSRSAERSAVFARLSLICVAHLAGRSLAGLIAAPCITRTRNGTGNLCQVSAVPVGRRWETMIEKQKIDN
jgi:hypothetical protein